MTVIDDGSTDETRRVVRQYEREPKFCCIRLGHNVGTAQAKNVGILASSADAITFHDSDDVPSPHKILLQARALALPGHRADEILDWRTVGHEPGGALDVDVVVGAYDLVKMDGSVQPISNRISLVDDFFPNLQFPARCEGDWCLINAGLFRKRVFHELGGYLDSIEEDRELRNRTVAAGCVYYFLEQSLLTKIEMQDSLTMTQETGYKADKRRRDRDEVWRRNRMYRSGVLGGRVAEEARVTMDLAEVIVEEVVNPGLVELDRSVPATDGTWQALAGLDKRRRAA